MTTGHFPHNIITAFCFNALVFAVPLTFHEGLLKLNFVYKKQVQEMYTYLR